MCFAQKKNTLKLNELQGVTRAASGTRTHDLFVTNEMLYRLSYCGLMAFLQCKVKNYFLISTPFSHIFLRSDRLFYNICQSEVVGYSVCLVKVKSISALSKSSRTITGSVT